MQRAISKETGKWEYGTYFDGFILKGGVIDADNEFIAVEEWHPVKEDTLCNCIGIKDSQNNMVYENDVIQSNFKADNEDTFTIRKISEAKGYGAFTKMHPGYPYNLSYIVGSGRVVGSEKGYFEKVREDNK